MSVKLDKTVDSTKVYQSKIDKTITIDSLKFRIPVSLVDHIDYKIVSKVGKHIIETGEVIEDVAKHELKEFKLSSTTSIRLGIQTQFNLATNAPIEYLVIYINSKLLPSAGGVYLEGIHSSNIFSVYNLIQKTGIVKMSYEVFCIAECSDIDFKKDFIYLMSEWRNILDEVENRIPLSNSQKDGIFRYNKSKGNELNQGLELGKRDSATYSRPYLKFYYKEGELLSKSKDFAIEHVPSGTYNNLCRIEATLKNKRHAEEIGIKSMKLIDLVMLDAETKLGIFTYAFKKHFKTRSKIVKLDTIDSSKKLGMKDMLLIQAIKFMAIETKMSKNDIIQFFDLNAVDDTKQKKHKRKLLIDEYFDTYLMPLSKFKMNETVSVFFNQFGM